MEDLFKNPSCGAMAGNRALYIIPTDEVQVIERLNFETYRLIPRQGGCFGRIFGRSIRMECTGLDGRYTHEVGCELTGWKRRLDAELDMLTRRRWIARVVDNSGQSWLSGSLGHPLRLTWTHSAQPSADGGHCYAITLSADSTLPLLPLTI